MFHFYIVIAFQTTNIAIGVALKGDSDKFSFIIIVIFFKNEKELQLSYCYSWKSDNSTESNTEKSHDSMYKTDTKNEAKKLRATTIRGVIEKRLYSNWIGFCKWRSRIKYNHLVLLNLFELRFTHPLTLITASPQLTPPSP